MRDPAYPPLRRRAATRSIESRPGPVIRMEHKVFISYAKEHQRTADANSYPLTFEIRKASAAARDRSIEINTGQFKFKIPH